MTVNAPKSIFPGLVTDAEQNIVTFVDGKSLLSLSGVSKWAFEFLSNEVFKNLFHERYPDLFEIKNAYTILKFKDSLIGLIGDYPKKCWKILYSALSPLEGSIKLSKSFAKEVRESKILQLERILGRLKEMVQFTRRIPILEGCVAKINDILSKGKGNPPSEKDLAAIKDAIDSDQKDAEKCWTLLHNYCSALNDYKGNIVENFSKYLPELAKVLKIHKESMERSKKKIEKTLLPQESLTKPRP